MATRSAVERLARSSASQFMCPRSSVTPWCMRNVSATKQRPFSSNAKQTGFANIGSAAQTSTLSDLSYWNRGIALTASSDALAIGGL
jgi:hypothetical protein